MAAPMPVPPPVTSATRPASIARSSQLPPWGCAANLERSGCEDLSGREHRLERVALAVEPRENVAGRDRQMLEATRRGELLHFRPGDGRGHCRDEMTAERVRGDGRLAGIVL